MGYFLDWSGWNNAVFALDNGFQCVEFDYRDIGIPYQHNSIDSFHGGFVNAMLKHVKLGFGHTSEFTSYEIRSGRLSRAQAMRLVKELDGRCHPRFIKDFCDWIQISIEEFWLVADRFRGGMWAKDAQQNWALANPVWQQFAYDEHTSLEELIALIDPRQKIGSGK